MTKEEAISELKETIALDPRQYDTEDRHIRADGILCKVLRGLGYGEVVDLYESIDKWYA